MRLYDAICQLLEAKADAWGEGYTDALLESKGVFGSIRNPYVEESERDGR